MVSKKAFTLIEILVVVVIIGFVSAFAIPSYSKAVDKALAKDMVNNLRMIAAAQEAYFAANKQYCFPAMAPVTQAALNLNLGLNIISQKGVTYQCKVFVISPDSAFCLADYPGRWSYKISTDPSMQPQWSDITCNSGTCPAGVP